MTVHAFPNVVNNSSTPIEVSSLLKLGCKLFPCRPDTKRPAITGWQKAATDDPVQLQEWLSQGWLLGIYCAESRFLGVEVDIKNDDDAWKWFHAWLSTAGFKDFDKPLQFSRSGAPHYAFRVPPDWVPTEHGGTRTFKISDFRALNDGEKDAEIFSIRNRGLLIAAGSVADHSPVAARTWRRTWQTFHDRSTNPRFRNGLEKLHLRRGRPRNRRALAHGCVRR
jgi:hypothetical protein